MKSTNKSKGKDSLNSPKSKRRPNWTKKQVCNARPALTRFSKRLTRNSTLLSKSSILNLEHLNLLQSLKSLRQLSKELLQQLQSPSGPLQWIALRFQQIKTTRRWVLQHNSSQPLMKKVIECRFCLDQHGRNLNLRLNSSFWSKSK